MLKLTFGCGRSLGFAGDILAVAAVGVVAASTGDGRRRCPVGSDGGGGV